MQNGVHRGKKPNIKFSFTNIFSAVVHESQSV